MAEMDGKKTAKFNKKVALDLLKRFAVITFGCLLYSAGISFFLDASEIPAGGVTGIAIVINHYLPAVDTGWIILILNIPLLITGLIFFGKRFIIMSIYATALSSVLVVVENNLFAEWIRYLQGLDNVLLSAALGGALFGAGIGVIFRTGGSTAGTDIIVKLLRRKFRHLKTGVISMIIDTVIVAASAFVYNDFEKTCYTFLSLFIVAFVFDWVLYGGNSAKLVYIVTTPEKADIIKARILEELDIGATLLSGKGAYTDSYKAIIMCAIKNMNYPNLHDVIKAEDPQAFTIVTSAKEIYGEGYKNSSDEEM